MQVFHRWQFKGFCRLYPDDELKNIDCMFLCTYTLRYYLQSDGTYHDFTGNYEITSKQKRKLQGSYDIR